MKLKIKRLEIIKKVPVLILLVLMKIGCKNFQEVDLNKVNTTLIVDYDPCDSYPFVMDFTSHINDIWTTNHNKLRVKKVRDTILRIDLEDCGEKYECWGKGFSCIDFSKQPVLKVRARMEGTVEPDLAVSLKDENGYDTNFNRPIVKIVESSDFDDYYFIFHENWKQGWPENKDVDPTTIQEILFFVNPGGSNWTGTIFIDRVESIPLSEVPPKRLYRQDQ